MPTIQQDQEYNKQGLWHHVSPTEDKTLESSGPVIVRSEDKGSADVVVGSLKPWKNHLPLWAFDSPPRLKDIGLVPT